MRSQGWSVRICPSSFQEFLCSFDKQEIQHGKASCKSRNVYSYLFRYSPVDHLQQYVCDRYRLKQGGLTFSLYDRLDFSRRYRKLGSMSKIRAVIKNKSTVPWGHRPPRLKMASTGRTAARLTNNPPFSSPRNSESRTQSSDDIPTPADKTFTKPENTLHA